MNKEIVAVLGIGLLLYISKDNEGYQGGRTFDAAPIHDPGTLVIEGNKVSGIKRGMKFNRLYI